MSIAILFYLLNTYSTLWK